MESSGFCPSRGIVINGERLSNCIRPDTNILPNKENKHRNINGHDQGLVLTMDHEKLASETSRLCGEGEEKDKISGEDLCVLNESYPIESLELNIRDALFGSHQIVDTRPIEAKRELQVIVPRKSPAIHTQLTRTATHNLMQHDLHNTVSLHIQSKTQSLPNFHWPSWKKKKRTPAYSKFESSQSFDNNPESSKYRDQHPITHAQSFDARFKDDLVKEVYPSKTSRGLRSNLCRKKHYNRDIPKQFEIPPIYLGDTASIGSLGIDRCRDHSKKRKHRSVSLKEMVSKDRDLEYLETIALESLVSLSGVGGEKEQEDCGLVERKFETLYSKEGTRDPEYLKENKAKSRKSSHLVPNIHQWSDPPDGDIVNGQAIPEEHSKTACSGSLTVNHKKFQTYHKENVIEKHHILSSNTKDSSVNTIEKVSDKDYLPLDSSIQEKISKGHSKRLRGSRRTRTNEGVLRTRNMHMCPKQAFDFVGEKKYISSLKIIAAFTTISPMTICGRQGSLTVERMRKKEKTKPYTTIPSNKEKDVFTTFLDEQKKSINNSCAAPSDTETLVEIKKNLMIDAKSFSKMKDIYDNLSPCEKHMTFNVATSCSQSSYIFNLIRKHVEWLGENSQEKFEVAQAVKFYYRSPLRTRTYSYSERTI